LEVRNDFDFSERIPTIRKVLEGVEARTIERINNAQINNVFVAADRFAEFVGQMNKAIEAMPAHASICREKPFRFRSAKRAASSSS
jgi:hypothetical protein